MVERAGRVRKGSERRSRDSKKESGSMSEEIILKKRSRNCYI